mmetsp:Transcript_3829/g.14752  ORF Transcript_3829/g.14752 Transcript_3829/m.14752 type:complete len:203 (-) Transcript_3829:126-734(-)
MSTSDWHLRTAFGNDRVSAPFQISPPHTTPTYTSPSTTASAARNLFVYGALILANAANAPTQCASSSTAASTTALLFFRSPIAAFAAAVIACAAIGELCLDIFDFSGITHTTSSNSPSSSSLAVSSTVLRVAFASRLSTNRSNVRAARSFVPNARRANAPFSSSASFAPTTTHFASFVRRAASQSSFVSIVFSVDALRHRSS